MESLIQNLVRPVGVVPGLADTFLTLAAGSRPAKDAQRRYDLH
jgi:hypothetical protein